MSKENRGKYGTASFGLLIFVLITVALILSGYEQVEWGSITNYDYLEASPVKLGYLVRIRMLKVFYAFVYIYKLILIGKDYL